MLHNQEMTLTQWCSLVWKPVQCPLFTHQLVDCHDWRDGLSPVSAERPDGRVGLGDLRPPRHVGVSRGDGVVGDVDPLHLPNLLVKLS